jgi:hypothetical protein
LAIASTIIDTYMGATKALAAGAGTPVGYINAAAIVATGLANLRTITAVQVPNGGECGCNCINANDAKRPKRWNYTRSNVADITITSGVKFANAQADTSLCRGAECHNPTITRPPYFRKCNTCKNQTLIKK